VLEYMGTYFLFGALIILDWLGIVEFIYNNKVHSSTKTLSFKANYGQDTRIGFEVRKKGKYKGTEKFVIKMKEI